MEIVDNDMIAMKRKDIMIDFVSLRRIRNGGLMQYAKMNDAIVRKKDPRELLARSSRIAADTDEIIVRTRSFCLATRYSIALAKAVLVFDGIARLID